MAFYATALSNFDTDVFPQNQPSNFRNRLATSIPLPQAYEVALSEISYCCEFKSADDRAKLIIFDFLFTSDEGKTWGKLHELEFDQSFITNPVELVARLNTMIWIAVKRLKRNPTRTIFRYDETTRRIWVSFEATDWVTICPRYELLTLLGVVHHESAKDSICLGKTKEKHEYKIVVVTPTGPKKVTRKFNAQNAESELPSKCETTDFFIHEPYLMENVSQFIVYSQIIKESHFASTFANVLKIITVPHDTNGQRVAISYGSDRVYLPVAKNELNQVNSL